MSATAVTAAVHCAHCHAELQGAFCHRCGEKRLDHHDYDLAHFAEHAVDTVTHFDFKVVKGMWSLLRHPGRMTADVLRGCRVPWPKPLQLFLITNLLYAFAATKVGIKALDTPLHFHFRNWYGTWARTKAETLATARQLSLEQLATQFNPLASTLAKTLVFALIPLVAGLLTLVLWQRRRYFLEHVVSATHYVSLLLLLTVLMTGPMMGLFWSLEQLIGPMTMAQREGVSNALMQAAVMAWTFPLLRRTYGLGVGAGLLATVFTAFGFVWMLDNIYRLLLFVVTYLLL